MHGPLSGGGNEAKLEYHHGQFRVLVPGTYVICAVTGARIPIEDLRYWSVDRQEAYRDAGAAAIATQRHGG